MGKLVPNGGKAKGDGDEKMAEKENGEGDDKKKKRKKKKDKKKRKKEKKKLQREVDGGVSEAAEVSQKDKETEEIDFWVPPVGGRWDNDEGGDRWGSDSDSEEDTGKDNGDVSDEAEDIDQVFEPVELFRTKRSSDDIEPSRGSSLRKKKKKENEATC